MTTKSDPILVTIKSRVATTGTNNGVTSESVAVRLGSAQYTAPPLLDGALGGFQVCLVAADTLELIENQSFSTGADNPIVASEQQLNMASLLDIQGQSIPPIVIISSIGTQPVDLTSATDQQYSSSWFDLWGAVQEIGGSAFVNLAGNEATYSLISQSGIGSELASQVHTDHADFASNIEGYLQQDISGVYHFVYPEFIAFETQAPGASAGEYSAPGISVSGNFYPAAMENDSDSGCQVCIFKRDTLEFVDNRWFATGFTAAPVYDGEGTLAAQVQQQAMSDFLNEYNQNGNLLVFVSGFGDSPVYSTLSSELMSLSDQLSNLGSGNPYQTTSSSFSLIGSPGLPAGEAVETGTSAIPVNSGNLVGILRKDNSGWYKPFIYTSEADVNNDLYSIIYQTPEAFPAMNDDEPLAYQYINSQVVSSESGKTVRDTYVDLNIDPDNTSRSLDKLSYPASSGFSQPAFNTVKTQLLTELGYVTGIQKLFSNIQAFNTALNGSQNASLTTVESNLVVDPSNNNNKADMFWLGLIRTAMMVGAIADPEPVTKAILGVESAGLFLGMTYENTIGNPVVKNTQYPIYQLEDSINNSFQAASDATGIYENIALTDWGKMQKIGDKVNGMEAGWTWGTGDTNGIVANMQPSFRAAFYQSLMAVKWQIIKIENMNSQSPADYSYETSETYYDPTGNTETHTPYKDAPTYASWAVNNSSGGYTVYLLTDDNGNYPSQDLMTDLFTTLKIPPAEFFWNQNGWNLNVVGPPTGD